MPLHSDEEKSWEDGISSGIIYPRLDRVSGIRRSASGSPTQLQTCFSPADRRDTAVPCSLACQAPIMTLLDSPLYEIGLPTSRAYGRLLRCLLRRVYMSITRCQPSYFTL